MRKSVLCIFVLILIMVFLPTTSFAGGVNRLGGVGPRAGGMSGSFTAVADDVSAFYYNLAGLSQLKGSYVFVGAEVMVPEFEYKTNGVTFKSDDDEYHILPLMGIAKSLSNRVVFGLGIYTPYGLGASFEKRLEYGFYETKSLISLTNISPALSFQLTNDLAMGVGINIGFGQFKYKAPLEVGGFHLGMSDSEANGWGIGGAVGLLWKPNNMFSWGVAYNTETRVKLKGSTDFDTLMGASSDDFETRFIFPARLGMGVAVRPTNRLVVALDINWFDYSSTDYMDIDYKLMPDQRQKLEWESNYGVHLGAECLFNEFWTFRGGIGYQTSVVPDSTVSPLTPDVTGWDVSAGIGYSWKSFSVEANYIHAWGDRLVKISPNNVAPGFYEADIRIFAIGLTYRF